jgi:hypothetical protein
MYGWAPVGKVSPIAFVEPFSTDWAQGGPLIEREGISIALMSDPTEWLATAGYIVNAIEVDTPMKTGPTALIAACRMIVAAKLGEEVDVPEELGKL